jgi:hypothetical protein
VHPPAYDSISGGVFRGLFALHSHVCGRHVCV